MPKKKNVETYTHSTDKRYNVPTEQTEPFMSDDDKSPVVYKPEVRQKSSKPKLSWGRDSNLDNIKVEAHPLYIHEKIHPANFINTLGNSDEQSSLFDAFNGLPKDSAFEWYQHQGNWQNRIIRGDSNRIMGSLLKKEGMGQKVQMIYFDPPYGISFNSNFQVSTNSRNIGAGVKDIPNDVRTISAFRDTYSNGIHSYLDNIYRNATLARDLLADSGSFFLQIGESNVHRLSIVLDEIFGAENKIATIPFAKTGHSSSSKLPTVSDYLLWYAKDKKESKYHQLYEKLTRQEKLKLMGWGALVELPDGTSRPLTNEEKLDVKKLPKGARLFSRMRLNSMGKSDTGRSDDYVWSGKTYSCLINEQWRVSKEGLDRLAELGRLDASDGGTLRWKLYEEEVPGKAINNLWGATMSARDMHYVVETAESVIERCILMSTDPGDLVLDITCGSGTTAYVAEKWGRRWITTDTSGVAVSLARQRITAGIFDFYLLQDSMEGNAKEAELSNTKLLDKQYHDDVTQDFVYERIPAVSAARLAYNEPLEYTYFVNRPYSKKNTIRVSSPFTVESESPYRYISPRTDIEKNEQVFATDQTVAIKKALEITGIGGKDDSKPHIRFKEITDWISSPVNREVITHLGVIEGEDENDDRNAALVIVPDDMTASATLINKAAEQALRIPSGVDLLVVIAFEFEPTVRSPDFEQRGKLQIIKAQANRDLQIGNLQDQKNDRAFVMIGEPDVTIDYLSENRITVEVLGYDTYNPATGNVEMGGG